jgi:uncharacterized RDD family membrane protein YckC
MALACVNHPNVMIGVLRCRRCGQTYCRNCLVGLRGQYVCAACKRDQVRDIQSGTEAGMLELASVGRRFAALWIDSFLAALIMVPVFVAFGIGLGAAAGASSGPPDSLPFLEGVMGLVFVLIVVLIIAYEGLMLSARGSTLGKMAVGIKVVTAEGGDISAGQAWGRAVLRQVFFSYLAIVNYLPAIFTKQKTAIHDLACKTRVVRFRG